MCASRFDLGNWGQEYVLVICQYLEYGVLELAGAWRKRQDAINSQKANKDQRRVTKLPLGAKAFVSWFLGVNKRWQRYV